MKLIVSIHQPNYLPWLGYFDRIAESDMHIMLDDVQFERNSFNNRNRIKTSQEWIWLTVPVLKSGRFGQNICEVEIDNKQSWADKHWKSIKYNYTKANFFDDYSDFLKSVYKEDWRKLIRLNLKLTNFLIEKLGIEVDLRKSSNIDVEGEKEEYILNLCKEVGAKKYFSGINGRDYLDEKQFERANIDIEYQNYEHPKYQQLYGEFIPKMSIIDLLLNHGKKSLNILNTSTVKDS